MDQEQFTLWVLSDDPEAVEWRIAHPKSAEAARRRALGKANYVREDRDRYGRFTGQPIYTFPKLIAASNSLPSERT